MAIAPPETDVPTGVENTPFRRLVLSEGSIHVEERKIEVSGAAFDSK